jgi:hypothetical protein
MPCCGEHHLDHEENAETGKAWLWKYYQKEQTCRTSFTRSEWCHRR